MNGSGAVDRWHVALTEPQAGHIAFRFLEARGYEAYYPTFPKRTHKGHGKVRLITRPMFPGYLFVNEAAWGWGMLRTAPGVRTSNSLLKTGGQYAVLPVGEKGRIEETERRLRDQIMNERKYLPYSVGDRVQVIGGPFEGRYAMIETLDDDQRIALLMDIFGRRSRVYTSSEHLRAAG